MSLPGGQRLGLRDVNDFPIDPRSDKTIPGDSFQNLLMSTASPAHHGRHDHQPSSFGQLQNLLQNLVDRLPLNWLSAACTMSRPCTGVEQSQKVVDLSCHGQRTASRHRGNSLIHTDRRRETCDIIDVGPRKLTQQRPSLNGDTLQITSLAFREQRIKGQRTLAGTADAGHHDQLASGQIDIHIAKIMSPRAADAD